MKTILVDDELIAMKQLEYECRELEEIEIIGKFQNANEALEFARKNRIDFALVDICMPDMDGLEFGRRIKSLYRDAILIYVTGHSKYVAETLAVKADYCVMKPYTSTDILEAIDRARLLSKRLKKSISVKTIGHFDVFVDDIPLRFSNGKAKELLAYCVSRDGALVSMEEAIDVLWPDRPYDEKVKRLYRKATAYLQNLMAENKKIEFFYCRRGACYVDADKAEFDFRTSTFDISKAQIDDLYENGYMSEYSWAEDINARLIGYFGEL